MRQIVSRLSGGHADPKKLWLRYAAAMLLILGLLGTSHIAALVALSGAENDAHLVNTSGRQRMLSQRILYFSSQVIEDASEENVKALKAALSLFQSSHEALVKTATLPEANRVLYFEPGVNGTSLDDKVQAYLRSGQAVLSGAPGAQLLAFENMQQYGPTILLQQLDQAVKNFENHATTNAQYLRKLQNISLAAAVFVLMLEAILIFWPAQRVVTRSLARNEKQKKVLQTAITQSQQQNKELTTLKEKIEHEALHDPLTGLANRRYLDEEIAKRMDLALAKNASIPIMHVDLDRFKQINDTLGHAAGDYILTWVAEALRDTVGDAGFVARVGGDEFVIVGSANLSTDDLSDLANRIIERLSEPVPYQSNLCYFGASIGIGIGIARDTSEHLHPSRLLANADIALYRAKERGRGCFEFFTSDIKDEFDRTKALSDDILIGIKDNQFIAHYQLQFDAQTQDVCGAEALVRWRHPTRGLLTPYHFLDVASTLNAIKDIDHQIMLVAAENMRAFDAVGLVLPKISVNVSAQRLEDKTFIDQVVDAKLDPKRFTFELTETVQLDHVSSVAKDNLKAIDDLGFNIEVDDFGTGHASILAVQNLRPKRLKIPRELITTVETDAAQRALVSTMAPSDG